MVSWFDAVAFCNRLSEQEKLPPYYDLPNAEVTIVGGEGYRLPTEAEWEFACRAGTTTDFYFGDKQNEFERFGRAKPFAGGTHPVGEKLPNPFGLYDMHGNVWEWCQDWLDPGFYARSPRTDPAGPPSGSQRACRGGSWENLPFRHRSTSRFPLGPSDRGSDFGFRLARTLRAVPSKAPRRRIGL